jgi:hypothetical protein
MIKKITFLLLVLFEVSIQEVVSATIDTTTVLYDFNNLLVGNLNGKDNWITTKINTTVDFQVTSLAGYDFTNALTFSQSGPSVGVDASRSFASLFSNTAFSSTASTYIITFDVLRSYWGITFSIGADINNDGKITLSDAAEKAITFSTGSQPGEKLTLPNGTVIPYPTALVNAWTTVEITLSNFNSSASGKIAVRSKILGGTTWNTIANNVNLGIDTTASNKKNPNLWKMIFIHFEGASGKLDNIKVTRIGPQILTAVAEQDEVNGLEIYPNPANSLVNLVSKEVRDNTYFILFDLAGREVERIKVINRNQQISLTQLKEGLYFYKLMQENKLVKSGKLILN